MQLQLKKNKTRTWEEQQVLGVEKSGSLILLPWKERSIRKMENTGDISSFLDR